MKFQKHSLSCCLPLFVALMGACASKGPGDAKTAEGSQATQTGDTDAATGDANLDAMLKREANNLAPVATKLANGSATILASGAPEVGEKNGTPQLNIPIGTQTAVQCYLYGEELIAGAQLSSVLSALSAAPNIEIVRVAPWNVGIAQDAPVVFVDVHYLAQGKEGKLLGELKFAIHPHKTQPAMCLHDEVGYRSTFEKVVNSLVESRAGKTSAKAPVFVEINRVSVGQQPVGFESTILTTEPDGKRKLHSVSTLIVPRSKTEIMIQDRASQETVDAKGRLEQGRWVSASGGQLGMRIELKRQQGTTYTYSGEVQGKNVQGEFKGQDKTGLATTISTAEKLKELLKKGAAFDFTQEEYTPGADPSKPQTVRYVHAQGTEPLAVKINADDVEASATFADNGRPARIVIPMSGAELVIERVHNKGKL